MAIPKYKDPITGKWMRVTTYGQSGNAVEITEISGETALSDDIITELQNDLNWISYGGGAYRFVSAEEDKRLYSYTTEDKISQILVNTLTKTCALRETQITAASVADSIVKRDSYGEIPVSTPSRDSSATNKAYVDDADKLLRLKLSNLEQALNGYILDTTKEAYADLDSAVLKDSVTVGDNVYPIADKTRALVTQIEGKTTKMVQLLDSNSFPATNSVVNLTVTKTDDGGLHVLGTTTGGGGRNSWGITVKIEKDHRYLNLLKGNKKLTAPIIVLKSDLSQYFSILNIATSTIEGECLWGFNVVAGDYDETIYPQLFDLTAMNREDITTVEQFKAEFPELYYPYENGNIYPAKISGVKFYENQDKSGEQASVTLPETYDLHGIGDYKDYLEITKNEDNELYTLKKVQNIGSVDLGTLNFSYQSDKLRSFSISLQNIKNVANVTIVGDLCCSKFITKSYYDMDTNFNSLDKVCGVYISPNNYLYIIDKAYTDTAAFKESLSGVMLYYALATPVETVIATNLTYEQVTAIRHNGGLIEVEGNTNKDYTRPTVTNTIVYRLTATSTAEG